MFIKRYDMYQKNKLKYSLLNNKIGSNLYYITIFLLWCFGYVKRDGTLNFINNLEIMYKEGISLEEVEISIDQIHEHVYFSEGYYAYRHRPTTNKIEELLEQENFIELCKIGFLNYIVMTKTNFIHILLTWDKILDRQSPFVLLYQDDKDWFDLMTFDSQETMEKFVADHIQK